jgi:hypothetical protein
MTNGILDNHSTMAKTPDSSKSESWTARVPNHLADAARERAIALGMTRDDGTANTTEIIHAALKQWIGIENSIPNNSVLQQLENQIAELFDKLSNTVSRDELEAALMEVRSQSATVTERVSAKKHVANSPPSESPIGTQELCKKLGISSSSLSTRAKRNDRTTEEQLISEALEKGQHWQVCDRSGRSLLWERVV